jgi:hypothetical protein
MGCVGWCCWEMGVEYSIGDGRDGVVLMEL